MQVCLGVDINEEKRRKKVPASQAACRFAELATTRWWILDTHTFPVSEIKKKIQKREVDIARLWALVLKLIM